MLKEVESTVQIHHVALTEVRITCLQPCCCPSKESCVASSNYECSEASDSVQPIVRLLEVHAHLQHTVSCDSQGAHSVEIYSMMSLRISLMRRSSAK